MVYSIDGYAALTRRWSSRQDVLCGTRCTMVTAGSIMFLGHLGEMQKESATSTPTRISSGSLQQLFGLSNDAPKSLRALSLLCRQQFGYLSEIARNFNNICRYFGSSILSYLQEFFLASWILIFPFCSRSCRGVQSREDKYAESF